MRRSPATRWAPCPTGAAAATAPAPASSTAGPPAQRAHPAAVRRAAAYRAPPAACSAAVARSRHRHRRRLRRSRVRAGHGGSARAGVFSTRVLFRRLGRLGRSRWSSVGLAPRSGMASSPGPRHGPRPLPQRLSGRLPGSDAFWSLPPSMPSARRMVSPIERESLDPGGRPIPSVAEVPGGSASAIAPPAPPMSRPDATRHADAATRIREATSVTTSRPHSPHSVDGCDDCRTICRARFAE